MTQPHVFVETNFLFGVFRMPSKRHRDALALKAQFGTGDVKLYGFPDTQELRAGI